MKDKILKIIALFLIFIFSFGIVIFFKKPIKCKVLNVIEADELAVDINRNGKIDNNEIIKPKGIVSFKPYIAGNNLSNINISQENVLKLGYLAKAWAIENLSNKEITIQGINNCLKNEICYADIYYNNENYSEFLLKNGLAYPLNSSVSKKYQSFYNIQNAKNNVFELSGLKFFILNSNSNILHKPNCIHAQKMTQAEILLKKDIHSKNIIFCKNCFEQKVEKHLFDFNIPKSKRIYKKSISKTFKNIDMYLINPLEYNLPSKMCRTDFCKRLLFEINNSTDSIDVALYDFGEQKEILDALIAAKKRGVKIRAVANYSKDEDLTYSLKPLFVKEFDVVLDGNNSLMHNKFFIFDNKLVMSGSSNISSTGSGGYNSNSVVFIKDNLVVQRFKNEFEQMFNSKFSKNKKVVMSRNSDIEVYFSPKDDIYKNVLSNLIKSAKNTIYVSAFYLTNSEFINDLILAKKHGIKVAIILDATAANGFKNKVQFLRNEGIVLAVENWGGKNHEKTIVIDDKVLIIGSCNFSKSGFYKNDENIIVLKKPEIAEFYSDYFLYLLNSIDKKYFVTIPRAEGFDSKNSCFDGIDNNFNGKIDKDDEACR